ncbi:MAG: Gfo/Idh/MocA family oxidoreductase [Gammaproteobacteria bacterium]|nr:Gfo/Idh/MocA family oxidoreductase [Gammaproteobacteria bacterium]
MAKLRMGMIGGGEGSFIGAVHRIAAELDGEIELVGGAFSSDPERSKRSGESLYGLTPERCYASFDELLTSETSRSRDERMHFVVIATPNNVHYAHAKGALEAGFHVMSDKPMTYSLDEALDLRETVARTGKVFGLTHNYTGYPMIKEARHLVQGGAFGNVRRINIEYIQGWLATPEETGGNKQAEWRTDPARSGAAGCIGDIGTHGENLAEYVTGLRIESLCADLTTFVPGRRLDDDANVLLRFEGGARGVLSASQIAVGVENGLTLRVYGELGGLEWSQMEPNSLIVRWPDRPYEVRRTGAAGVSQASVAASRIPPGHPEGFLEAFALLYRNFATAVRDAEMGKGVKTEDYDIPSVNDGVRGMQFIETVVASSNQGSTWLEFPKDDTSSGK